MGTKQLKFVKSLLWLFGLYKVLRKTKIFEVFIPKSEQTLHISLVSDAY